MAVALNWHLLVVILEVAFGLGMVIFVHELGHFAVAKWCGVKCEKFYLGFDLYGLKLARVQWGETEYGIGILPLGGYVKMLGQDDNPARAAGERERSILRTPEGETTPATSSDTLGVREERYQLDPRSYMAKSVPQRMAIISAGVIMNVMFAFLMAAVAYGLGVRDVACGVSAVLPGEAAWKANLQPGDQFLQIDHSGRRQLRFRDLMTAVALGDIQSGIDFEIERPGVKEPFWVNVKPDPITKRLRPTIGVLRPLTLTLSEEKAVYAGTPAARTGAFKRRDKIVALGGTPVHSFADYEAQLVRHSDQPLTFTIERTSEPAVQGDPPTVERLEINVAARPMRTLGLVMKMGKITAVQNDSPAAAADLRAGDYITSIDGQSPADPLRLPNELRRRAGQTITLSVSREGPAGEDEKLEKSIVLRDRPWPEESEAPGNPVSVPALGIAYKVLNFVHQTDKDGPAARASLTQGDQPAMVPRFAAGDEIVRAEFVMPRPSAGAKEKTDDEVTPGTVPDAIEFSADKPNWPFFMWLVQQLPADTQIKLTLKDGRLATLPSAEASDWFYADRGLIPDLVITTTQANSLGQALAMGWRETKDAVLQTYAFVRRIGSQISPFILGGPKTIAEAAGSAAYDGISELLIFLTLLSANLAVINFLPIPLLDGGHMVFLILEGTLRRPVSEKVVVAFHYLGFLFIISLMLFVLGLDFGLIPRPH
jgi:regulator of sigma E protease